MSEVIETTEAQSDVPAVVPTNTAPMQANPTHNPYVDVKEFKFNFRKDDLGNKRPSIEVKLPVPSVEGIAKIFNEGGKGLETLVSLVHEAIGNHVRSLLNDDEKQEITAANFPYDQATWDAFINVPEGEKRGRGIAKEIWDAFGKDYIEQMPAVTGKTLEQVTLAAKLFLSKFQPVKTNKVVIAKLKDQLGIYMQTANAEQYVDCIKFLDEKADLLLQADESALLENL